MHNVPIIPPNWKIGFDTSDSLVASYLLEETERSGRGQNLEQQNVERPIFQNLKIADIKITKDELIDSFIFEFFFLFF